MRQHTCRHLAGHGWDEGCSTTAPLLRLDEGDLAVRSEIPDHFVKSVAEAAALKEQVHVSHIDVHLTCSHAFHFMQNIILFFPDFMSLTETFTESLQLNMCCPLVFNRKVPLASLQELFSPWMQLVDRSINSNCDLQFFLAASLPHLTDHTSEPCCAHMSGASGHTLTDQPHDVTVQLRGKNAQRRQDVVDLFSVPRVTEKNKNKRETFTKQLQKEYFVTC